MLVLKSSNDQMPVTLSHVKAYLRLDTDAEDDLLQSLMVTATDLVEAYLDKTLIQKTWSYTYMPRDDAGDMLIPLPMGPLSEIMSVTRLQPSGKRVSIRRYSMEPHTRVPTIRCVSSQPVEVIYTTGFGMIPLHIPPVIRQAVLVLVAHFYENRTGDMAMPQIVQTLLQPYRSVSL